MAGFRKELRKTGFNPKGGDEGMQKKCRQCGRPLKSPKYDLCYNCSQSSSNLPDGYLKNGYFDAKGNLPKEMIIDLPSELAHIFQADRNKNKFAAVRKFYNKIKALQAQIKRLASFEEIKQDIWALDPEVTYQYSRDIVTRGFADFIKTNIALATRSEKDFLGFAKHFMYIIAYYKKQF